MTISGATRAARARQNQEDGSVTAFSSNTDAEGLLGKLVQFVPAELITTYGVAIGLFTSPTDKTIWSVLAIAGVVLVILTLFDIRAKNEANKAKDPASQPVSPKRAFLTCLFLLFLFVLWSLATAGSPLSHNQRVGCTVFAVFFALIAQPIAKLLDITPST